MPLKFISVATMVTAFPLIAALALLDLLEIINPGTFHREIPSGAWMVVGVFFLSFVGWSALCFLFNVLLRLVSGSFIGMWVSHDSPVVK